MSLPVSLANSRQKPDSLDSRIRIRIRQIEYGPGFIFTGVYSESSFFVKNDSLEPLVMLVEFSPQNFGVLVLRNPKHPRPLVHIGATWQIRLNRLCAAAMRPFCQITLTTCCFARGNGCEVL